ncbi:Lysyl oxidase homolog 3A [Eumeta japonica]|uniref:protein-lysine 6-oxidase n=1 Tax=Eumeta variegata TaxID=151549 RepID=A0A4C1SW74_EUMVA|nr:Lysyl oxidase homolog 3A [Eumeta japonica]
MILMSDVDVNYIEVNDIDENEIDVNDTDVNDINANDIDVNDIDVSDIDVHDIDVNNIALNHIDVTDIDMIDIDVNDIDMSDIDVINIDVNDIAVNNISVKNFAVNDIDLNDISVNDIDGNDIYLDDINVNDIDLNDIDVNDIDVSDVDVNYIEVNDIDENEIDVNDTDVNDINANDIDVNDIDVRRKNQNWQFETRRLLRFTATALNVGDEDFRPYLPKHLWQWHECHMHYHSMEVFATFNVLDLHGRRVAEGHKASFCLEDNTCMRGVEKKYSCKNYGDQGVSVNCSDIYRYNIDCQWVDVTDVKPGHYIFNVAVNPHARVAEQDFYNNAASCRLILTETYASVYGCVLQKP